MDMVRMWTDESKRRYHATSPPWADHSGGYYSLRLHSLRTALGSFNTSPQVPGWSLLGHTVLKSDVVATVNKGLVLGEHTCINPFVARSMVAWSLSSAYVDEYMEK